MCGPLQELNTNFALSYMGGPIVKAIAVHKVRLNPAAIRLYGEPVSNGCDGL